MAQYLSTLGKITVTQVGSKVQRDFSSFYSEKPAVFVFIRRFGCGICRWSAKDLKRLIPIIGDKANVVAIAPEWLGSEDFVKNNYWTDELYVEETKTAYKTVGFERYNALSVMGALVDKKVIAINKKAQAEGIPNNFQGDTLTKGGVLVIGKGGETVLLEFKQKSAGDHCPPEDILKALNLDPALLNDSNAENAPSCTADACAL